MNKGEDHLLACWTTPCNALGELWGKGVRCPSLEAALGANIFSKVYRNLQQSPGVDERMDRHLLEMPLLDAT
jgi:hypothetical protein